MTRILCEYVNQKGSTVICLVNEWNDCVIAIDVDNMEKTYLSSFPIDDILYDVWLYESITFSNDYIDSLIEYLNQEENEGLKEYILNHNITIFNEEDEEVEL